MNVRRKNNQFVAAQLLYYSHVECDGCSFEYLDGFHSFYKDRTESNLTWHNLSKPNPTKPRQT